MAQIVINELSSLFLTFGFTDEIGDPVVPTTIDWRVDNVDDPHLPVQILDWSVVAGVAASVNVQIAGSNNAIADATQSWERRLVTVRMDSTLSTQAFQQKYYRIKNLHGAP